MRSRFTQAFSIAAVLFSVYASYAGAYELNSYSYDQSYDLSYPYLS